MPIYQYKCNEHGTFEIFQRMTDIHETVCPVCNKDAVRIYQPHYVKCGNAQIGKTRMELFDNMASEGFASKDWREHDTYYKNAKGITD